MTLSLDWYKDGSLVATTPGDPTSHSLVIPSLDWHKDGSMFAAAPGDPTSYR